MFCGNSTGGRTCVSMVLGRYTSVSFIPMPVGRVNATTGQVSPRASNAARRADRCSATPPCGGGNGPSCNTLIASLCEIYPRMREEGHQGQGQAQELPHGP